MQVDRTPLGCGPMTKPQHRDPKPPTVFVTALGWDKDARAEKLLICALGTVYQKHHRVPGARWPEALLECSNETPGA